VEDDCCDGYTCNAGICQEPGACPTGCNHECSEAAARICDLATRRCIQGAPPLNCLSDCDCYSGEACEQGACVAACLSNADCADGLWCIHGDCQPPDFSCATRDDCAGVPTCLVCRAQACMPEPAVCAGDQDCCVGRRCNFGSCVPVDDGCVADSDCLEADFPRCVDGSCVQECVSNIDCPEGWVCLGIRCEPNGCTPQTCDPGQWCDTGDGTCKPGCDSNDDCTSPQTCNYATHACGQTDCCGNACVAPEYCDTLSCACAETCVRGDCTFDSCTLHPSTTCDAASNKCVACPANFTCDAATGRCVCAAGSCPANSSCNTTTGMCEPNLGTCNPTCVPPEECNYADVCVIQHTGLDGDPCFADEECDASQGFLCDGCLFCINILVTNPDFWPEFVCRAECSLLAGTCTNGAYTCEYRHSGLKGLCVPPP